MLTRRRVYGVNEYVIRGVSSTELINLYDLKPTATAEPNFQDRTSACGFIAALGCVWGMSLL